MPHISRDTYLSTIMTTDFGEVEPWMYLYKNTFRMEIVKKTYANAVHACYNVLKVYQSSQQHQKLRRGMKTV
jgi:hypothetical protein